MPISFSLLATDGAARRGRLETPHGTIETPAFMPVGTLGAVKGLTPDALEALGASVMLANLYHLTLRPGIETIESLGGLHAWNGWSRPILTDSGGFQVWSLADRRKLDPSGVTFRSHVDGAKVTFTPESVVDSQRRLGVDIAMVLDECPAWPVPEAEAAASLDRTVAWARRARERWSVAPGPGGLFGILQGSSFPRQRARAAEELAALDFDGYAIGGVSVGEPEKERRETVAFTAPLLPADKPRYLMGVGTPEDILHAVRSGIDLFDCVLPARNARHSLLFTSEGLLRLKNTRYRTDPAPPDPACSCPTCRRVSRSFLAHLLRTGEITGQVLATVHNLAFYLDFMGRLRQASASGTLSELAAGAATTLSESPA